MPPRTRPKREEEVTLASIPYDHIEPLLAVAVEQLTRIKNYQTLADEMDVPIDYGDDVAQWEQIVSDLSDQL